LTIYRNCYLHVEQVVLVFCWFSFFSSCLDENSGALIPGVGAQLTVRGGRFLLSKILFLVIVLVLYLFVVYNSLRDDRR
jgi:hypothetical protein